MKYLRTASSTALHGTVFLRLDFNTEDGWRLEAAIPTVKFLLRHADRIVIGSHRGRPEGRDPKLSLKKDAAALRKFLKRPVTFLPTLDFPEIKELVDASPKGSVFLLENLRFNAGEAKNDPRFARDLASLADYYVNEAFPVSHRAAASVVGITEFLPSYAGLLLEREIVHLNRARHAKSPLVLLIGGAKAHDKLGVMAFFKRKANAFLMGGAAANTLLFLAGVDVGRSLIDKERSDFTELRSVLTYKNLVLPVDWRTEKGMIFDIGEKTEKLYTEHIKKAKTIIWSGPMGFIEKKKFEKGNLAVAKAIAANRGAFSITGGGETVMFLKKHRLDKKFTFISTGGGAMVDFLAGEKLPGIEALK